MSATKKKSVSFLYSELGFGAKEAFKRLRTNVSSIVGKDKSCHIIGITSAQPSEGKSLTAVNYSSTLSETGRKVLLIDADIFRPSVHKVLGLESDKGFSELMEGASKLEGFIKVFAPEGSHLSLDVLTAGAASDNPSKLLNSRRFGSLLETLSLKYDYIVVDMPPIGSISDVTTISQMTDGVLVVIREGHCPQKLLRQCVEQLQMANVPLLGFVLNGAGNGSHGSYYKSSYKYYNSNKDYYSYYSDSYYEPRR